jgi:hypothetical protein
MRTWLDEPSQSSIKPYIVLDDRGPAGFNVVIEREGDDFTPTLDALMEIVRRVGLEISGVRRSGDDKGFDVVSPTALRLWKEPGARWTLELQPPARLVIFVEDSEEGLRTMLPVAREMGIPACGVFIKNRPAQGLEEWSDRLIELPDQQRYEAFLAQLVELIEYLLGLGALQ